MDMEAIGTWDKVREEAPKSKSLPAGMKIVEGSADGDTVGALAADASPWPAACGGMAPVLTERNTRLSIGFTTVLRCGHALAGAAWAATARSSGSWAPAKMAPPLVLRATCAVAV